MTTTLTVPDKWKKVKVVRITDKDKISAHYSEELQTVYGNSFDPIQHEMVCVKALPTDLSAISEVQMYMKTGTKASDQRKMNFARHASVWLDKEGHVFYLVYNFTRSGAISEDCLRNPSAELLKYMTKAQHDGKKYTVERVTAEGNAVEAPGGSFMPIWPTKLLNPVQRGRSSSSSSSASGNATDDDGASTPVKKKSPAAPRKATPKAATTSSSTLTAAAAKTKEAPVVEEPLTLLLATLDEFSQRMVECGDALAFVERHDKGEQEIEKFAHRKIGDSHITDDVLVQKSCDSFQMIDTFKLARGAPIDLSQSPSVRLASGLFLCMLDPSDTELLTLMNHIFRETFRRRNSKSALAVEKPGPPSEPTPGTSSSSDKSSTFSAAPLASPKKSAVVVSDKMSTPSKSKTSSTTAVASSSAASSSKIANCTPESIDSGADDLAAPGGGGGGDVTMAQFSDDGLFGGPMNSLLNEVLSKSKVPLPLRAGMLVADCMSDATRAPRVLGAVTAMLSGTGEYTADSEVMKLGKQMSLSDALSMTVDASAAPNKAVTRFVTPFIVAGTAVAMRAVGTSVQRAQKAHQQKVADLERQLKRKNDASKKGDDERDKLKNELEHRDKRVGELEAQLTASKALYEELEQKAAAAASEIEELKKKAAANNKSALEEPDDLF